MVLCGQVLRVYCVVWFGACVMCVDRWCVLCDVL